ncbi:MAG: aminoglycoside phosphotransferase [Phormidesmis priestleyi]|uniref:Aminoglycoside phosphotransferase n=1 Tax=Phormidesmis priestleyi TaxID=268141 RepID=A0A2W4XNV3_9CYAN|nr:MAG: aminoglycoside phosphotransferase [Phormidesmis priestleyi]
MSLLPDPSANFELDPDLAKIAAKFVRKGVVQTIVPLGNGNINSTFLVTATAETAAKTDAEADAKRFVLQRINTQVFRQPERVIQNMRVLSDHLRDCPSQHLRRWETPQILLTNQNQSYWIDEAGEYWRAISFIEHAHVLETVENAAHAQEIGYGLAMFHSLISTLPADKLTDTLEGFHITPTYLAEYERVRARVGQTRSHPSKLSNEQTEQVLYCLTFVEDRKAWAHVLERAKAAGHLKLRPIHGDPKVNNIMLADNGQAVSLIDLDTIKPGLVHYDIGDCLRSGCNPLGEETEDWQNVVFDTALAEAMLKGYLSLAKDFLTEQDYDYLYDAIRLIAFELGLRFLTDYLAGNVYFKVTHPTHNLTRALVQLKLTESIEQQADTLKKIIQSLR